MWKGISAIVILFYIFALLQNSFFVHFNLFGVVPDIVFILYFSCAFFLPKIFHYPDRYGIFWTTFLAVTAGFFSGIFLYPNLGLSIICFVVVGFILRQIQLSLLRKDGRYPFLYFLSLFIISLLGYYLLVGVSANFLTPPKFLVFFTSKTIFSVIYDSVLAVIFFYIYDIFSKNNPNTRQLKLFR